MTQTQLITIFGVVAAAAGALSQVPGIEGTIKLICVGIAAVAGSVAAFLAKGRADTGVQ